MALIYIFNWLKLADYKCVILFVVPVTHLSNYLFSTSSLAPFFFQLVCKFVLELDGFLLHGRVLQQGFGAMEQVDRQLGRSTHRIRL